jgi:uncharacterized protein (DUF488 family)
MPLCRGSMPAPLQRIWTIGHSTLPIERFIALLQEHGIKCVADVRRYPASRRHPQFEREALQAQLVAHGIRYEWLPELGGRRAPRKDSRNTAWRNSGFRGYADYMETEPFQLGTSRLVALACTDATACMCAERAWQQCHRGLVSDYLKAAGWQVLHILSMSGTQEHPFTEPARLVDGQLIYAEPGEQGELGL